ncbi:hypothetical protein C8Q77DRAFT_707264 [Trametes polyzona]|nr:hypothetical protein C8Q77DRAFT_707264 [Trametes polyzona]
MRANRTRSIRCVYGGLRQRTGRPTRVTLFVAMTKRLEIPWYCYWLFLCLDPCCCCRYIQNWVVWCCCTDVGALKTAKQGKTSGARRSQ